VKLAKKNIVSRVFLLKFVLELSYTIYKMKNFTLVFMLLVFLGFLSCQKDTESQSQSPQNLTKTSALTTLLGRVSQSPTSKDNILDGTNCFAVVLPVSVTVNSINVAVNDSNQYETVRDIINANSNDDDLVNFSFPIRLKFPNFQEVLVANQQEYNAILANCGAPAGFDEIACIDFNYPVILNTYNSATQTPNTITISSNSQLYNFLDGLTSNEFYNIVYPVSMTLSNGDNVVYNSNVELQAGIENVIDDCDDDPSVDLLLSEVIVSGSWKISSFIDGSEDKTADYEGYIFTFSANGTSLAVRNATSLNGNWASYVDSNESKLELSFFGDTLEEIEDDWRVIEFSEALIKLRHVSGGDGEVHYLTFEKM
jgi:hypothetical protein